MAPPAPPALDVVYIVRDYPADPQATSHLRHSLRSLVNWPHGRVWLVGHRPSWAVNVGHIPTVQISGQRGCKDRNMTDNVIAACREAAASSRVVLLNDDMFYVRPGFEVSYWHSGPLSALKESPHAGSPYMQRLTNTRRILADYGVDDPLMYENMHHPTVIDRRGFLDTMGLRDGDELVFHQTVYLNVAGVASTQGRQRKIRDAISTLPGDEQFVSTGPDAWRGNVGEAIRRLFPDPCRYERA